MTRKIAITGHTKGLGKALFDYFSSQGSEVRGFSRSTGYVLPFKMQEVLKEIEDCDVFINNSFPVTSQVTILYQLFNKWRDKQKTIVTIGSHTTDEIHTEPNQYYAEKFAVDAACKNLRKLNPFCRIILLRPSYFASERMLQTVPRTSCMGLNEMCNLVDYVISSNIHFEDILFQRGQW